MAQHCLPIVVDHAMPIRILSDLERRNEYLIDNDVEDISSEIYFKSRTVAH
jgi:hypothetical protein